MAMLRQLLVAAMVIGALIATGYLWGQSRERARHQAEAARAAKVAQERFDAEVLRGREAVTSMTAVLETRNNDYQHLERAFNELSSRRIPIVAAVGRAVPACRTGAAASDSPVPGEGGPAAPDQAPSDAASADAGRYLSAGALWMWNSALAGMDEPAGACGAADTSEQACAPASAFTLDDAWRNHKENARLCAIDRARHQALIDFISNR